MQQPSTLHLSLSSPAGQNLREVHEALQSIIRSIKDLPQPDVPYDQIKNQCLHLQKEFVYLASQHHLMTEDEKDAYVNLTDLFKTIDAYVTGKDSQNTNAHLKFLAYLTAMLTPMGVLVGYFGMNFSDMGAPSNNRGVFSFKHGHYIVFAVMVLVVIFMTYMYYFAM